MTPGTIMLAFFLSDTGDSPKAKLKHKKSPPHAAQFKKETEKAEIVMLPLRFAFLNLVTVTIHTCENVSSNT